MVWGLHFFFPVNVALGPRGEYFHYVLVSVVMNSAGFLCKSCSTIVSFSLSHLGTFCFALFENFWSDFTQECFRVFFVFVFGISFLTDLFHFPHPLSFPSLSLYFLPSSVLPNCHDLLLHHLKNIL